MSNAESRSGRQPRAEYPFVIRHSLVRHSTFGIPRVPRQPDSGKCMPRRARGSREPLRHSTFPCSTFDIRRVPPPTRFRQMTCLGGQSRPGTPFVIRHSLVRRSTFGIPRVPPPTRFRQMTCLEGPEAAGNPFVIRHSLVRRSTFVFMLDAGHALGQVPQGFESRIWIRAPSVSMRPAFLSLLSDPRKRLRDRSQQAGELALGNSQRRRRALSLRSLRNRR